MENFIEKISDLEWKDILLRLHAFTRSYLKYKGWFRVANISKLNGGLNGEAIEEPTYLMGKEASDYVDAAVEIFLLNPEKYNPERGSLINYLCYSIVRNLVKADLVSAENRNSTDVSFFESQDSLENDEDSDSNYENLLPSVQATFPQNIDSDLIFEKIQKEIKDPLIDTIFIGTRIYGLKRREVIKEFNISEADYDNGMRRLKTILKNIAIQFEISEK